MNKRDFLSEEEKRKIISEYMPTFRENEVINELDSIITEYKKSLSKIDNIKELELTEEQLREIMKSYKLTIRFHVESLKNLIYHKLTRSMIW